MAIKVDRIDVLKSIAQVPVPVTMSRTLCGVFEISARCKALEIVGKVDVGDLARFSDCEIPGGLDMVLSRSCSASSLGSRYSIRFSTVRS